MRIQKISESGLIDKIRKWVYRIYMRIYNFVVYIFDIENLASYLVLPSIICDYKFGNLPQSEQI